MKESHGHSAKPPRATKQPVQYTHVQSSELGKLGCVVYGCVPGGKP